MKFSIIIPFYKGVHYLKDCFDSLVLSINYCKEQFMEAKEGNAPSFEILLVFDDPESKSEPKISGKEQVTPDKIEEELSGLVARYDTLLPLRLIRTKGTQTVATLRNAGICQADGDYLYFLDSDDYLAEQTLYALGKTAADSGSDIITGPMASTWFKREGYFSGTDSSTGTGSDTKTDADSGTKETKYAGCTTNWCENLREYEFSALHLAIKKSYLKQCSQDEGQESLLFEDSFPLYPDVAFVTALFSHLDQVWSICPVLKWQFMTELLPATEQITFADNALYVKRYHNDAIQYPAYSQQKAADRAVQYKKSMETAKNVLPKHSLLRRIFHDITVSKRKKKRKAALQRIGNFFKRPTFLFRMIDKICFRHLPMKENWIVFESFLGKNYSDSCKYIYEYLLKHKGEHYRYIWVINDKKAAIPGSVTKVRYLSLAYFYYTTRAKYYVNNMRQPIWLYRRPGSVLLETWHGTPLKRLVFDMEDIHAATPSYKMDMYKQSRAWSYLVSDNPFSTEVFQSCFLYEREKILETGYPRNDLLYDKERDVKALAIKQALKIPTDKKVILYAPTWRDDEYYGPGEYRFALKFDLEKMKQTLGDDYVILLRTHYFIADAIDTEGYDGFAYNVSRYDDITELYLIADICITDYSSVFFDYANLCRPILFYVYDFEKYKDTLRGFYINMETELPGPLLYTQEEVWNAILHIEEVSVEYKERYETFYKRFCSIDDGFAAKRVVDAVFH